MKHELLSNFAVSTTTLRARSFSAFVCSKTKFARRSFAVVLVAFAALSHTPAMQGQSLTITTLAGLAGASGSADGTGSAARFNQPAGVATDSSGNVYVADHDNHTIRKITPAGAVTTLAGLAGIPGSADAMGSAARFRQPTGVATDSSGNVYVGDFNNHTIRKITPAGAVTTLAGLAGARVDVTQSALGDLHDLTLEIAVTAGEGRVIPYTLATENGSGDTILRIE